MLLEMLIIILFYNINFSLSLLSIKIAIIRGRRRSSLLGEMDNNNLKITVPSDSILDKLFRPSHIGIPRKRMDLQFAVLLMR
jgi:hypothetical protein